jgi:cytochrome c peroxidase
MVYHGAALADRRNLDTVDAPFSRRRGQQSPMTDQEMRDVVAFLRTLTDGYVAPRP